MLKLADHQDTEDRARHTEELLVQHLQVLGMLYFGNTNQATYDALKP
jgi:hypothetical protein